MRASRRFSPIDWALNDSGLRARAFDLDEAFAGAAELEEGGVLVELEAGRTQFEAGLPPLMRQLVEERISSATGSRLNRAGPRPRHSAAGFGLRRVLA